MLCHLSWVTSNWKARLVVLAGGLPNSLACVSSGNCTEMPFDQTCASAKLRSVNLSFFLCFLKNMKRQVSLLLCLLLISGEVSPVSQLRETCLL